MLQPKSIHTIIDYRNARYQGHVDDQGNRNQLGVLIDDDLSFYVSHWNQNRMHGQTLVYISHGKYIYGEWINNQPNGLNVFRTGDTVLVGEFINGEIIGKILVIFQKYNIIAVLQTKSSRQKFQVFECGKLVNHDDLLKYIQMLDIQMPEHFFSLIKFVTLLTNSQQNEGQQPLIASPCEVQSCYFGYRDGLAIVFNSNNGVVSVGHHQNKQICGYGGKFDGNKIQEGNFEMKQTILYDKKRPKDQVYTIFHKMHKRSLSFRNQYFDSKLKTLGDLHSILRGNIQKIVNYNMKNKIHEATVGDLNDSLDYQNMDEHQSQKTCQKRQTMYEKQAANLKKATSHYQKQDFKNKATSRRTGCNTKQIQKSHSKLPVGSHLDLIKNEQQTVRRTPNKRKQSEVYFAKKSPLRFSQQDGEIYSKQSRNRVSYVPTTQCYDQKQKKDYKNHKPYQISAGKSPINYSNKSTVSQHKDNKVPKFGGLDFHQTQESIPNKNIQSEVKQYRKQLQKSRSKDKLSGHSIGKCLRRPNYEDIQERRRRLLNQFKQLNDSNSNSRLSNISQAKRKVNKQSIQIEIDQNQKKGSQRQNNQSQSIQGKILSYTSQNENGTENSSQGCIPLSLINNGRGRNNRVQDSTQKNGSTFSKKHSFVQNIDLGQIRNGKQNVSFTPSSFVKYKRDLQNSDIQSYTKQNGVKKFNYKDNEQRMPRINLSKKSQSQHTVFGKQEDEQNHFTQIKLKHQESERTDNTNMNNFKNPDRLDKTRQRPKIRNERQLVQRDHSPLVSDISRRKSYKYYFQE